MEEYSNIVFLEENEEILKKLEKIFTEIKSKSKKTPTKEHGLLNNYLRNALNQARIINCL